tara:strand:- start:2173 stop:2811 length:639 start_codon:yes stop_codon:yes gene_type:complete
MNSKSLIIIFSIFLSIILSIYILSKEDNFLPSNSIRSDDIKPKIQVANRGEPRSTLKSGYVQVGRLQAMIPLGWKREKPSNSMRIAQFTISGDDGDSEIAVFSGIGGGVDANLERWYSQFENKEGNIPFEKVVRNQFKNNNLEIITSYIDGTYLKSSMGMGGETEELKDYALMAAIILTDSEPYYFKATGPKITIDNNLNKFEMFIKSIENL